jgi:hypothetical protein
MRRKIKIAIMIILVLIAILVFLGVISSNTRHLRPTAFEDEIQLKVDLLTNTYQDNRRLFLDLTASKAADNNITIYIEEGNIYVHYIDKQLSSPQVFTMDSIMDDNDLFTQEQFASLVAIGNIGIVKIEFKADGVVLFDFEETSPDNPLMATIRYDSYDTHPDLHISRVLEPYWYVSVLLNTAFPFP